MTAPGEGRGRRATDGHRLIRFDSRFCSSTHGLVAARQHTSPSPSGRGGGGSRRSSSIPIRCWRSWSPKLSQGARTRSASPVATGRSRSSRRPPGLTRCHSCASPLARAIIALDIGVDRSDLLGTLDAFTDGVVCRIDVAEVNGRLFLNNVSLGIYGDTVQRPGYRDAKLRTLLETAHAVLGPSRAASQLHIADDLGRDHDEPAVVLVSNNPTRLIAPW